MRHYRELYDFKKKKKKWPSIFIFLGRSGKGKQKIFLGLKCTSPHWCHKNRILDSMNPCEMINYLSPYFLQAFKEGTCLPNQYAPNLVDAPMSLSPYLRFGCVSVRAFYWRVQDAFTKYKNEKLVSDYFMYAWPTSARLNFVEIRCDITSMRLCTSSEYT